VRKFYPEIILREKLKGWQTTALLSFQEELADFVKMIGGDYRVTLADGHAGLRSIEVSEAVRSSSRTGQPVELPNIGNMYR
jgi:predicted dehydrogenase